MKDVVITLFGSLSTTVGNNKTIKVLQVLIGGLGTFIIANAFNSYIPGSLGNTDFYGSYTIGPLSYDYIGIYTFYYKKSTNDAKVKHVRFAVNNTEYSDISANLPGVYTSHITYLQHGE